jgi:hypothetical protein
MIEMAMRDQYFIKPFKAYTGLQNLALSSLSAVDQKAIFIVLDDLGRQVPPG